VSARALLPAGEPAAVGTGPPAGEPDDALIGRRIGPYLIEQRVGSGGMGSVYRALREDAYRQQVALKVIRPGLDSAEVVRRFRSERQALADLDHPHIARLLDGGTLDDGRPYFVMEYIDGRPLDRYAEGRQLGTRERVGLVQAVCRAVQYAHERGVIHRDLKPDNVLVTADGTPKVTDFGLAKRLAGEAGPTQSGDILGTPSYMAPEQAAGRNQEVGPAADVYALGALLYQLLTGRPPFRGEMPLETLRQVLYEEPVPPSRLHPKLARDLETVCLTCLHKDPSKRYPSVQALAEDLRRFGAGEPIVARPAGVVELGLKWVRRRPTAAALAGVAVLVLLGGVAGVLWYAGRERGRAKQENALRQQAEADEAKARQAEAEARAVLAFFQDKVLAAARPEGQEGGLGKAATIRAALDAAEPGIEQAFAGKPAVEASIRNMLGTSYMYLGDPPRAIRQYERALALRRQALDPDHPDTLLSMNNLAAAYWAAGRRDEALPLFEQALKGQQAQLGPDHPFTLLSMDNLGAVYQAAGRRDDAIKLHEEALKGWKAQLGPDHPDTVKSMTSLGAAYRAVGRWADAVALLEEALRRRKAQVGPDHPDTLSVMDNLASTYQATGRLAEALPLFEQALKGRQAKLGPDHPDTLTSMNNLALAYRDARRPAEALSLLEQALRGRKAKLDPDHPDRLMSMHNLAAAYWAAGRLGLAQPLAEEALKRRRAKLGPDHSDTLGSMGNLAAIYLAAKQPDKALPLLHDFLAAQRRQLGPDHPRLATILAAVGLDLLKHGHYADAEKVLREGLKIHEAKLPDDWRTFHTKSLLGGSLLGQHKYAEAEPLLRQGYEGMKARAKAIPPQGKVRLTEALERVVQLYDAWGKKDKADEWRKEREAPPARMPLTK
jgi:tetratricopeptide (TPR) repeat protein